MPYDWTRALRRAAAWGWVALATAVQAQAPAAKKKPEPPRASAPAPAKAAAAAERTGKGWRTGARGAWVVEPAGLADVGNSPPVAGAGSRRDLLVDFQSNYTLSRPAHFYRVRMVAADASTLGAVSQPQIAFNPVFQSVVLHEATVLRDGRRLDRLAEARIELMRREQRLEQQVIDGAETLLVVLNDVRTGETVEVSYTVEGENPIHEGRISTGMRVGWEAPVDLIHYRLVAPAARRLEVRTLAGAPQPEHRVEGDRQVVQLRLERAPGQPAEQGTPPWFKAYPAVIVSDWASWTEVDAWAQRLFALPPAPNPGLAERVAAFRAGGLQGEALVAEVLRFVQDEVRYFSVSLGESSHRPKPPERTLAERVGDCKDKVVLLNALLGELGFRARPALVSTVRNRGLAEFPPGHDEFDHVITRVDLDGKAWYLDATMNGQGLTLAGRGYFPFGLALVVGGDGQLQPVAETPELAGRLEFEQLWDHSRPGQPSTLRARMRATGLVAERWRAGVAMGGEQRIAEAVAAAYSRMLPALRATGTPAVTDDRRSNTFELVQQFELPDAGRYAGGSMEVDVASVEMVDALVGPPEARRRTPFLLDQPRVVESRIVVQAPRPLTFRAPAPLEVPDRHFRFSVRTDISGSTLTVTRRVERLADQVAAADLESFRANLLKARQQTAGTLRMGLADTAAAAPDLRRAEQRITQARGFRRDRLSEMLMRNEALRIIDGQALALIAPGSPSAARAQASRAQSSNLLGEFGAGLADAEAALAIDPKLEDAMEAQAVALVGLGRLDDALAAFRRLAETPRRPQVLAWQGALELQAGRAAAAEALLRDAVDATGPDEREFVLLWLFLAAEQQGAGRGREAVAAHLERADATRLPGALLRMLAERLDRDAVLKLAREKPEMERLNMAEACFYIGRLLTAQGRADEARRWYERAVETGALPYREVTFASLALGRRP